MASLEARPRLVGLVGLETIALRAPRSAARRNQRERNQVDG